MALKAINRCIELQPDYPKAKALKEFTANEIAKRNKAFSN